MASQDSIIELLKRVDQPEVESDSGNLGLNAFNNAALSSNNGKVILKLPKKKLQDIALKSQV